MEKRQKTKTELYLNELLSSKPISNFIAANNRKTAIYARVSTESQADEGYSIQIQLERLSNLCKANGWNNYEEFVDGGHTGSNLNRPEMIRMIEEIISNKIERVVVFKLDRISRNQKDTLTLIENIFLPFKVSFVSLTESFDTSTPHGRTMIGIMSAFAQLERETIKERTSAGRKKLTEEGYWRGGGGVPFGYSYDKNQKILVPNEDAEKVRTIFRLCCDGIAPNQIYKIVGFKHDTLVRNILNRKTYLGIYEMDGKEHKGLHEAIITQEEFDTAQYMLSKRKRENNNQEHYLLSGLLVCGECGCKFRYQKWGDKVKVFCVAAYPSNRNRAYLKIPEHCDNIRFDADVVESIVLKEVSEAKFKGLDDADELSFLSDGTDKRVELLVQEKNRSINIIKRLYDVYATNPSPILLERIGEHEKTISQIEDNISNLKVRMEEDKKRIQRIKSLRKSKSTFEDMSMEERRILLKEYISSIYIYKNGSVAINYNLFEVDKTKSSNNHTQQ